MGSAGTVFFEDSSPIHEGPGTRHPDYLAAVDQWHLCRHAFAGEAAIKEHASAYVPRVHGDSDADYEAYVQRAAWYGATARTVEGLTGAVFRVAPTYDASAQVDDDLLDITLLGDPMATFAQLVFRELLITGRCPVLVDLDDQRGRPYWVMYTADQLVSWLVAGDGTLLRAVIITSDTEPEGEFDWSEHTRAHVHELDAAGLYQVRHFIYVGKNRTDDPDSDPWKEEETLTPMRSGARLDYIPMVVFGARGIDVGSIYKPPIYDVATVNVSHFRTSADWEHGAHMTALPTPWVSGIEQVQGQGKQKTEMRLGARTAWLLPKPDCRAGMLEYTGKGLDSLKDLSESKKRDLAVLGARLLAEDKTGVETVDAMRLRSTGESSVLSALAEAFDVGMARALAYHQQWMGIDQETKFTTNRDFIDAKLTPQEAQVVMALWQSDLISFESAFRMLQMGEWIESGLTPDEELDRIAARVQDATGMEIGRGSRPPVLPPEPPGGPPPGGKKKGSMGD